jgi:AcrR family transcriptional regulator
VIDQPAMRANDDRERRSVDERRAQLVQAAVEVIAEDGLGRATTRRITDHADLALGAFHYAFRSKDELLEAVVERLGTELDTVLRDAAVERNLALEDTVERLVTAYWTEIDRAPDLQLARYELTVHALREPRQSQLAAQQHNRHVRTVASQLARAADAPDEERSDEIAHFLLATMDGLVLQWFLLGEQPTSQERVATTMRCLRALLPG